MQHTADELAKRVGGTLEGDGSVAITGVAGVRDAAPGDIAFVSQSRYAADAASTRATALIVGRDWKDPTPAAMIRVDNPEAAFTEVARLFAPLPVEPVEGVHASAVVAKNVKLGKGVSIGACSVVEAGAVIGDRTVVYAGCYVGHGVTIGEDCKFYPHVSLREHVQIGDRVIIHDGTVVGSDGFGYNVDKQGVRTKIPQIGNVVIGDDVEIGANVTIDRARFGRTRIGKGVKIDNLVQIAHNVNIGDHSVIVAQVGISGSTMIGHHVIVAGQAGVAGHLVIGAGSVIGGQSAVTKDVPPGIYVSGYPAAPHRESAEMHANIHRLPQLKKRVAELEKRLAEIEQRTPK